MPFSTVFEKLGRAVFESPFESKRLAQDAPELAEMRLAAIDAIKSKSHRVGSQTVFPCDLVRIHLAGIPPEQEAVFRSAFLARYFADELKTALTRSSFRFPSNLQIEFSTTSKLPLEGERWITVETLIREQPTGAPDSTAVPRKATLCVVKGTANVSELRLEKARTNIGRTLEVYRGAGPSRRNDLAFVGESDADGTVSREHAHILRSTTGEYRLFNDRSYRGDTNCGLWIVRDGLSFPVHHGARGCALQTGDEIYLGTAVLRFTTES